MLIQDPVGGFRRWERSREPVRMERQPGREGASGHLQSRLWRRLTSERRTPRGPLGGKNADFPHPCRVESTFI